MSGRRAKAVVVERISPTASEGIAAAALVDLPTTAALKPHELRVRVRAASINFPELLMMQNKYQYKPPLPFVLCTEGSGEVLEAGAAAKRFKKGDRVIFSWTAGCAREELALPEEACWLLPKGFSFGEGAGFLMTYETAYHALVHRGRLQPGEWLLVTGAGGGVGSAAVQLGKALGARVIAAASSQEKLELCKRLGADHTLDYSGGSLAKLKDAVKEITKGAFCDVIFEPVGGDVFEQCVRCVATKGNARLLVIGFASGRIPTLPVNMALIRRFDLVGVMVYGQLLAYEPQKRVEMVEDLRRMAEEGKVRPYVGAEFPLERFREAFTLMNEQKVLGKCCITFGAESKL